MNGLFYVIFTGKKRRNASAERPAAEASSAGRTESVFEQLGGR